MELKLNKVNGQPFTEEEAEVLFNFFRNKFELSADDEVENNECFFSTGPLEVEIHIAEDDKYVYAAALCPGITRDRIVVLIDDDEIIIKSCPANDGKKDKSAGKPFLWKCIESISYVGECKLPAKVIPEEATAELRNGVVYILLPKPETAKPRSIPLV